jgi:hypothetical protein
MPRGKSILVLLLTVHKNSCLSPQGLKSSTETVNNRKNYYK